MIYLFFGYLFCLILFWYSISETIRISYYDKGRVFYQNVRECLCRIQQVHSLDVILSVIKPECNCSILVLYLML